MIRTHLNLTRFFYKQKPIFPNEIFPQSDQMILTAEKTVMFQIFRHFKTFSSRYLCFKRKVNYFQKFYIFIFKSLFHDLLLKCRNCLQKVFDEKLESEIEVITIRCKNNSIIFLTKNVKLEKKVGTELFLKAKNV